MDENSCRGPYFERKNTKYCNNSEVPKELGEGLEHSPQVVLGNFSASLFLKRLRAEIIQIFQNPTIIRIKIIWKCCGFLILEDFVGFARFLFAKQNPTTEGGTATFLEIRKEHIHKAGACASRQPMERRCPHRP
jgi:hypothetical protein